MGGYVKLFCSILDSTIWGLSKEARLLWITMLAKKDRNQKVWASVPGLAHAARISLEEAILALEELKQEDAFSRSKEFNGRRIEEIPEGGGWYILNGERYRDMITEEENREYQRVWVKKKRDREKREQEEAAPGPANAPKPEAKPVKWAIFGPEENPTPRIQDTKPDQLPEGWFAVPVTEAERKRRKKDKPLKGETEYVRAMEAGREDIAAAIEANHTPGPGPEAGAGKTLCEVFKEEEKAKPAVAARENQGKPVEKVGYGQTVEKPVTPVVAPVGGELAQTGASVDNFMVPAALRGL